MHSPPHPGAILREDVLPGLKINVTEAARQIGVSRVALSRLINERAGFSPEMALKIEDWFEVLGYTGGRADHWMRMQLNYDMWQARKTRKTG
jgi:addiction module HigA family antidote